MNDAVADFKKRYGYPTFQPVIYFPGGVKTTAFGDDFATFYPDRYRVHQGVDRAKAGGVVFVPFDCTVKWVADNGQGCSILRMINAAGFEVRIWHLIETELNPVVFQACGQGTVVPAGTKIGTPGNKGISVGTNGGRHAHTEVVGKVRPDRSDFLSALLSEIIGPTAFEDEDFTRDTFTVAFSRAMPGKTQPPTYWDQYCAWRVNAGISVKNQWAVFKTDALTGKPVVYVDSLKFFGF